MNSAPIGVIDSGVGGLTIAKEIIERLPNESIFYFGDTLRCPYGPRPIDEIKKYTIEMVQFLSRYSLKAMVIACNTATVAALDDVRALLDIPVIGVVAPGARAATKSTQTKRVAVIGTKTTIESGAYQRAIAELDDSITVISKATPNFVSLVESGEWEGEAAKRVVENELKDLHHRNYDTLVLGCTHFPLIQDLIGETIGDEIHLINPAEETVEDLIGELQSQQLLTYDSSAEYRFFTSGSVDAFRSIVQRWLPLTDIRVEHMKLEQQINSMKKLL